MIDQDQIDEDSNTITCPWCSIFIELPDDFIHLLNRGDIEVIKKCQGCGDEFGIDIDLEPVKIKKI